MNPAEVAKYLRELADAGAVENEADRLLLKAAANIVLLTVGNAIRQPDEGQHD